MRKLIWLFLVVSLTLALARPVQAQTYYVVQRGDTLYRISLRFGVSVSAIAAANGLANPSLIYVGQRLLIPETGSPPPTPAATSQYVVQRGDTLYRIARRFNTTVAGIMAANNLKSSLIYAGQILRIPGAGGNPAPSATPPATQPGPTPTVTPAATPCGYSWFFSNPPTGACPATAAVVSQAAAERFEHGLLLWVKQTDTYYALNDTAPGSAARLNIIVGPLTIKPGGSLDNRVGGAPAGRFEPVSGFGLLWRGEAQQYQAGLRTALGWATEAEHSIETKVQCAAYPGTSYAGSTCYLLGPSGETVRIYHVQYFGDYWERWPTP
ncbi:MAG: LysM peptidoglycan-binding domain-containing protein [Anaerolineales bacterium]|nr:LysM peptidoglycan-binding domain-containing protein [Anaerolineales bacterium]